MNFDDMIGLKYPKSYEFRARREQVITDFVNRERAWNQFPPKDCGFNCNCALAGLEADLIAPGVCANRTEN